MRRWLLTALLLLPWLGSPPASAQPRVDTKAILDLALRWFAARPPTRFEPWDRKAREALLEEAKALGPLPEGSLAEVVDLLMKAAKKHAPKGRGEIATPYGTATWLSKGKGGAKEGLVLGLHGGGEGAGSASEPAGTWTPSKHLCFYPQGIRLVHDTWNSVHGERFLLTLIEIAKAQYDVDPDRVYSMGFSMGGSGSMFMAGRHPDLLAGAIPAHGVIAAKGGSKVVEEEKVGELEHGLLPNLRNVAAYFYTGELDRNCEPGTFKRAWTLLNAYRDADPEGYGHIEFHLDPQRAHSFPPSEPGQGMKWILEKRRNTHPDRLTWEYNDAPWPWPDDQDEGKSRRLDKQWFYWLYCRLPRDRMRVDASITKAEGRTVITLQATAMFSEDFTVYLSPALIDPTLEVEVRYGGKSIWTGRPVPDFVSVLESFDARLDRQMVYDRRIVLPE